MVLSDASSTARVDSTTSAQPPSAGAPAQPRAPGDTAHVPATLRGRMGAQLNGATRYFFPFLSSTIQVVAGLLIIVFLSIYIAVDPDMYRRGHVLPFAAAAAGEVLSALACSKWLVRVSAMLTIGAVTQPRIA
jgi:hypothetical protein